MYHFRAGLSTWIAPCVKRRNDRHPGQKGKELKAEVPSEEAEFFLW